MTLHVLHPRRATIEEAVARVTMERSLDEACDEAIGEAIVVWTDPAELAARIDEVELLLVSAPPRGPWAGATRLRLIHLAGVGAESLLPAPDLPERVRIASARGLFAAEAAEHAVAVMLAVLRGIPQLVDRQRARRWQRDPADRVEGKTLGILGLGTIGQRVARVARALGMRVIATRRSGASHPDADEVLTPTRTAELLARADVIVVALPSTPATHGLLDGPALAGCRAGAVLINIARGGIVDEQALAQALAEGRLAGAALDVFEREPLPPDSPLWDAPNLLVTPHCAGFARDYAARLLVRVLDNVARLRSGAPLLGEVDRVRGY
jgi:phosphoglycerate dehydrogenase-like enzyme